MTLYAPDELPRFVSGVFERELKWGSPDEAAHPWIFKCNRPACYYAVAAATEEQAREREAAHLSTEGECPFSGPAHYGTSITMGLVEEIWEMADKEYAKLIATGDAELTGDKFQQQRGILAGISHVLVLFMKPRFSTTSEIAEQVKLRHRIIERGERPVNQGLGNRVFDLKTRDDSRTPPMTASERAAKILKPEEINAIGMALDMKVMTVEQLTKMYSCTAEVVNQCLVDYRAKK